MIAAARTSAAALVVAPAAAVGARFRCRHRSRLLTTTMASSSLGDHGSWDWRKQGQQQQQQAADESAKQFAPAASRNQEPILAVLKEQLGRRQATTTGKGAGGALLEVACGTGQHAAAFARALIGDDSLLTAYLPTDLTGNAFASVRAHTAGVAGVLPPRTLDASLPADSWFPNDASAPPLPLRAILAVNLTHISPWPATLGLLRGAARFLDPTQGLLFVYGPFTRQGGEHVGEGDGNARFDATLRAQDPEWGYRDVERDVVPAAAEAGLELAEVVAMPANNLFLVFRRKAGAAAAAE